MRALALGLVLCFSLAAKTLDVYFIDVEGGQSTLVVAPSGQSLLVDTGYAGFNGRDSDRIVAAARLAGVKQIDYLAITHYHADHVGGVAELAAKIPIKRYIDHGPNSETGADADARFKKYTETRGASPRQIAAPGQKIPVQGIDVEILASDGNAIKKAVNGGGAPNPLCASVKKAADDPTDNAHSIGMLIRYGKFRFLDLGDLTWNKELELVCPNNLIGNVDVYLTTHHASDTGGPAAIVHALRPRVAIMNNGANKGGVAGNWAVVRSSPGLLDLWQLHYAVAGGKEHNVEERYIANPDPDPAKDQGHWIKLSAEADGSFTVTNGRNNVRRVYNVAP
jgi:beta-lactamase superfamily II metal-dependent hydrolase